MAAASLAALPFQPALAQDKPIDVAAIYTVPVEQQWVSRIHKALNAAKERGDITYTFSENVANTDYERVMREYAEQGMDLVVGEAFAVERAARKVAAEYPETAFLMGSSFGPAKPNFAVFDNWIHEPSYLTGMIAGATTESDIIGMVGGYAIPEVNRLMNAFMDGALSVNPDVKFLVTFINSWYDPPKAKEFAYAQVESGRRPALRGTFRRFRCGQGKGHSGHRQRHRHGRGLSRNHPRLGALAHGTDHRPGHRGRRRRRIRTG